MRIREYANAPPRSYRAGQLGDYALPMGGFGSFLKRAFKVPKGVKSALKKVTLKSVTGALSPTSTFSNVVNSVAQAQALLQGSAAPEPTGPPSSYYEPPAPIQPELPPEALAEWEQLKAELRAMGLL